MCFCRELGFEGVVHGRRVTLLPTVNCIVELSKIPFTVIALDDIGRIVLECVGSRLKTFNMDIVFKVGGCWCNSIALECLFYELGSLQVFLNGGFILLVQ